MSIEPRAIPHMRAASYLLPDPGGSVVRDLLDEVERLQSQLNERLAPDPRVAVLDNLINQAKSISSSARYAAPEMQHIIFERAMGLVTQLIAAQRGEE